MPTFWDSERGAFRERFHFGGADKGDFFFTQNPCKNTTQQGLPLGSYYSSFGIKGGEHYTNIYDPWGNLIDKK